jgi:hypothetical protein
MGSMAPLSVATPHAHHPLAQTEEARAEAITLMGSVANLSTPKNGEILIAATQVGPRRRGGGVWRVLCRCVTSCAWAASSRAHCSHAAVMCA